MKKVYKISEICGIILMISGCAQTAPAPVVSGYQKGNQVLGVGQESQGNSGFSLTREVSSKAGEGSTAVAQTAPESVKEEDLQSISPAAGPAGSRPVAAALAPEKRSLVQDWTSKPVDYQGFTKHTVQPGETVYRLARRYNTTPGEIVKLNHMDSTADLASGQVLQIPAGSRDGGAEVAFNRRSTGALPAANGAETPRNGAQLAQNAAVTAQPPKLLPPVSGPTDQAASRMTAQVMTPADESPQQVRMAAANETKVASIEPAAGPVKLKADARADTKAAVVNPSGVKLVTHTVTKGETVYRIAHAYGASVLDVMSANNFSQPQQLKSGMVVKVPVHEQVKVAEEGTAGSPAPARVVPHEEDETATATPVPAKTAVDEVKAAFNKGKIDPVAARVHGLAWPVHGQIIRRFGTESSGVTHAGINIAVPPNTPVLATDGGTVLYAGSGLKTYGNLVLVRHKNGMVSAYAHNNQLLVTKGDTVKKGQVIALSGATGNVDKPQLHFELRRDAGAVDPMTLLAAQ